MPQNHVDSFSSLDFPLSILSYPQLISSCSTDVRCPRAHRLLLSSHSVTFVPCFGQLQPFSLAARSVASGIYFIFFPLFLPLVLTVPVEYLDIKPHSFAS